MEYNFTYRTVNFAFSWKGGRPVKWKTIRYKNGEIEVYARERWPFPWLRIGYFNFPYPEEFIREQVETFFKDMFEFYGDKSTTKTNTYKV